MNHTARRAAIDLIEHGYAKIKLPQTTIKLIDEAVVKAKIFFNKPKEYKHQWKCSSGTLADGYLAFGTEKDKLTNRPDLQETYKAWYNRDNRFSKRNLNELTVHKALQKCAPPFASLTNAILFSLYKEICPGEPTLPLQCLDLAEASYMQLNFSRPRTSGRDLIMDLHEDGHLLTIVKPSGKGLLGCSGNMIAPPSDANPSGLFQPGPETNVNAIELDDDEAIVLASSPTYFLTGGLVKPFFHAVASTNSLERFSTIFFANPRRKQVALPPWREGFGIDNSINIYDILDSINYHHEQRHEMTTEKPFQNEVSI